MVFNSLNKISVHMSMQWLRTHTKGCALYRVTLHTKMVGTSTIASVGVRDNHITSLTHLALQWNLSISVTLGTGLI